MLTDEKVKLALIKATKSVRQKYKELKNDRVETRRFLDEAYKSFTTKFTKLIDTVTPPATLNSNANNVPTVKIHQKNLP